MINPNESLQNNGEDKYILHINNFDGSLDLLWYLIQKSKIDITEILISQITEQYIEYLNLAKKMNIKIAAEFVTLASELLYYKSNALLPEEVNDDEYYIAPLPRDLIQKLLEYKQYQSASIILKNQYEKQEDYIYRKNIIPDITDDTEFINISLFDLINIFSEVLNSNSFAQDEEIIFDEILVSERINTIDSLLLQKNQILFREMFLDKPSRAEVIASFMAILEMTKTGRIKLLQHTVFGDIILLRI